MNPYYYDRSIYSHPVQFYDGECQKDSFKKFAMKCQGRKNKKKGKRK